jgi:hypothetical protein
MHAPLARDEAPAVRLLPDAASLLDALEARRVELGLSNATLEQLVGPPPMAFGHVTKILGPAREKSPTLRSLDRIMEALGLSFVLVRDAEKIERVQDRWRHRAEARVRHRALSPTTIARARPHIMARLAKRAAHPRWADVPARDFVRAMTQEGGL